MYQKLFLEIFTISFFPVFFFLYKYFTSLKVFINLFFFWLFQFFNVIVLSHCRCFFYACENKDFLFLIYFIKKCLWTFSLFLYRFLSWYLYKFFLRLNEANFYPFKGQFFTLLGIFYSHFKKSCQKLLIFAFWVGILLNSLISITVFQFNWIKSKNCIECICQMKKKSNLWKS